MADIIEMQIALAKRALRDAEQRLLMQRVIASRLDGEGREEADRVLGELNDLVDSWRLKLSALTQARHQNQSG